MGLLNLVIIRFKRKAWIKGICYVLLEIYVISKSLLRNTVYDYKLHLLYELRSEIYFLINFMHVLSS